MSPLHSSLALGPLAAYLVLLGFLNLSRRPFLTTGARDLFALGLALCGLFVVGPLDLFMPQAAALRMGPYVWLFLLGLYFLCLSLCALMLRPRLVIYNFTVDQLRPLLAHVIQRLGLEYQWAGESLTLPTLGVQLQLEKFPLMRNVSLVSNGAPQSYRGWQQLERELAHDLADVEVSPNPVALSLLAFGVLVFVTLFMRLVQNPAGVARSLLELLRMS